MKDVPSDPCTVAAVLFDFGGVVAEEGFVMGLEAIARKYGRERESFVRIGDELVYRTGFVTGRGDEQDYWEAVRRQTGIGGTDAELRGEILSRFILRPWMLEAVRYLRASGVRVGLLSDQTAWLDELNARWDFFREFDEVFNSYHLGTSKRDSVHYQNVLALLGLQAEQVLLVDDRPENCERAKAAGLHAILYSDRQKFYRAMAFFCPAFGWLAESHDGRKIH